MLIHGVGLDLTMWDAQAGALASEFRVLRYDLLGHGQTPSRPITFGLRDFTGQLLSLLSYLRLNRVALIGFSMGGVIAQRFAADAPDRVGKLVLMNTVYRRRADELRGVTDRLKLTAAQGPEATAEAAIERWFTPAFRNAHPDVTAAVHKRLVTNDVQGYVDAYRVFVEADRDIRNALTEVSCPALIVTGSDDVGSTPDMARRMAADLRGARVVILKGLRHMAPVEDPERINHALITFLHETA